MEDFILTLLHYFFNLITFYRLGQKYENIFVRFLEQIKTLNRPFVINWPLKFRQFMKRRTHIYVVFAIFVFPAKKNSKFILKPRMKIKTMKILVLSLIQFKKRRKLLNVSLVIYVFQVRKNFKIIFKGLMGKFIINLMTIKLPK